MKTDLKSITARYYRDLQRLFWRMAKAQRHAPRQRWNRRDFVRLAWKYRGLARRIEPAAAILITPQPEPSETEENEPWPGAGEEGV